MTTMHTEPQPTEPHESAPTSAAAPTRPTGPAGRGSTSTVRDERDGDCLVFFVCLVTGALAMLGLALLTDLEGLPRLLLTGAITTLAGVSVSVLCRTED